MVEIFHKVIGAVIIGLLAFPVTCFPEEVSHNNFKIDLDHALFKPKLIVRADPICNTFLQATLTKFISTNSDYSHPVNFTRLAGPFDGRNLRTAAIRRSLAGPGNLSPAEEHAFAGRELIDAVAHHLGDGDRRAVARQDAHAG